jgi:hypothetical protein
MWLQSSAEFQPTFSPSSEVAKGDSTLKEGLSFPLKRSSRLINVVSRLLISNPLSPTRAAWAVLLSLDVKRATGKTGIFP